MRVWRPDWPCPVGRDRSAPTGAAAATRRTRSVGDRHWRGIRTPEGPATLAVEAARRRRRRARRGVGAGRGLGARVGAGAARRRGRPSAASSRGTRCVEEAWRRYRALAVRPQRPGDGGAGAGGHRAEGDRAGGVRRASGCSCTGTASARPAPARERSSGCSRPPRRVRQVPSWEWLRMHVDPARSRTVVTAARVADSLERTVGLPGDEVERRLTQPARHRRLDRRRGAAARARRPRRGVVRRLPRRARTSAGPCAGQRLRRRRAGRVPGAVAAAPRPGVTLCCSAGPSAARRPDGAAHAPAGRGPTCRPGDGGPGGSGAAPDRRVPSRTAGRPVAGSPR